MPDTLSTAMLPSKIHMMYDMLVIHVWLFRFIAPSPMTPWYIDTSTFPSSPKRCIWMEAMLLESIVYFSECTNASIWMPKISKEIQSASESQMPNTEACLYV